MSGRTGNDPLSEARQVMKPFLDKLATKPGVQAISIISSSARSPANPTSFDQESDFDVSLVLDVPMAASEWRHRRLDTYKIIADRIPEWVPNFLFYVPMSWGRMEVNVHQLVFQYESDPRTPWDGEKCDTYLTKCEVIVDREGLFRQLIERKARDGQTQLAIDQSRLANRITWDISEMPRRQARRLGPASGHFILNLAIDEVVDCIYVSNHQFIPNKKWKLAHLVDRSLIAAPQATLLSEALRCDPSSMADLERRIRAMENLCNGIEGIAISGPAALVSRRSFQSRIELRGTTLADMVSARIRYPVADTVRDLVNFTLCGSSVELAGTLRRESWCEPWQTVVPKIRDELNEKLDGGFPYGY